MDIGVFRLRSALRVRACRKAASLQNAAPRRFAVAQSSPFLQIPKTTARKGLLFLVPVVGLEPTRCRHQRILSFPLRWDDNTLEIPSGKPEEVPKSPEESALSTAEVQKI